MEESINEGLTVIQRVAFDRYHKEKLSELLSEISEDALTVINTKYEAWKKSWKEYSFMSNPRDYARSPEYKSLLNTMKLYGRKAWVMQSTNIKKTVCW